MNNPIFMPAMNVSMYSAWMVALTFITVWLVVAYFRHKMAVTKYFALYFILKVPALGLLLFPSLLVGLDLITKYNDLAVKMLIFASALMNAMTIFWALMFYELVFTKAKRKAGVITAVLLLPFVILPFFANVSIQADPTGKLIQYELGSIGLLLLVPHLLLMVTLGIYFVWRSMGLGEKILKTKAGLIGLGLIASGAMGPINFLSFPIVLKYIFFTISQLGHFLILGGIVYGLLANSLFLQKKATIPSRPQGALG